MSDVQDESTEKDSELTKDDVLMDEVAERRPVAKKNGYVGTIVFLVLVAVVAGAAWYFQSMWLPQVKHTYQQAQTMMHDFVSDEKPDPMAAPMLSSQEDTSSQQAPEVVVSAIVDEPVKEITPAVAEAKKMETSTLDSVIKSTDSANTDTDTQIEVAPVATATFIEQPVIAKTEAIEPEAVKSPEAVVVTEELVQKPVLTDTKTVVDLVAARQAFWQRDLPKAEALYKQQIKNAKANADSWGELGNIYYLQAKWQQAASAYTEAALLLLNKGDFPQAMFLRYIVFGLDPVQAQRIDDHVKALQAPLNG